MQTAKQPNKKRAWLWQVLVIVVLGTFALGGAFFLSKKSLSKGHLLSSVPKADETYAAPPINITLTFDQTLVSTSSVTVVLNGSDSTQGDSRILDSTTLQKDVQPLLADGEYEVSYNACFQNSKCETGTFNFRIGSGLQKSYSDLRNKQSVELSLEKSKLSQTNIIVSPGTDISWVNKDARSVSISTETPLHPEYFSSQNSGKLQHGEKFQLIFVLPGQYNYEAVVDESTNVAGSIIVAQ